MKAKDHILVVDDDQGIRELLRENLERYGFAVSIANGGRQMRSVLAGGAVDLIVLDLMLPGEDGLSLCRELHAAGACPPPILMLTALREEADRILGLELGADDYLAKPFSTRELVARVRAILRRSRMAQAAPAQGLPAPLQQFGTWRLDNCARHLLDSDGAMVALSGAEYRLLRVFLEHPMRVLSRDQLLGLTQGHDSDSFDRSIDILVSRLRKRLRDGSRDAAYIRTVRSEGYMFSPQGQT
ncbi:MAG: two component transcriptional regulator, winged helix family [Pseudoduganella sp.]|nr:two component transcriptional regulator, winged helix family [Pseudoduganella sp.]